MYIYVYIFNTIKLLFPVDEKLRKQTNLHCDGLIYTVLVRRGVYSVGTNIGTVSYTTAYHK